MIIISLGCKTVIDSQSPSRSASIAATVLWNSLAGDQFHSVVH
jgi:hypothetical protein